MPVGYAVREHDWRVSLDEAVEVNRTVERHGPDSVEVPPLPDLVHECVAGVVTQFHPLPASVLSRWPGLEFVATLRAGTENIDTAELRRRGVALITNAGRNANAVAEFTVAAILGVLRRIGEGHHAIRTGGWRPGEPIAGYQELAGLTVGLVGFGAVGSLVARRLSGFDTRILVTDPYAELAGPTTGPASGPTYTAVEAVPLPTLLRSANVVSLHARLTAETRHLLDTAELDLMPRHAVLVNTARAELVNEDALVERLVDGRIAGAALDVFSTEPLPGDHPLRRLPTVSLSPHLAGATAQARLRAPALLADRIASLLTKAPAPGNQ